VTDLVPVGSAKVDTDQIERVVIGALMVSPTAVTEVGPILQAADFYKLAHGAIYSAILANAAINEPTDPLAIAITLDKIGDLHRVGGVEYLHTCQASVPSVASARWYARQVKERAFARRTESSAIQLAEAARTGDRATIARAYDAMQHQLAASPDEGGAGWQSQLSNGASFIFDIPDKVPIIWGDGDDVLWSSGEALMICGPQGVGKTTLLGQVIMARLGLIPEVLDWPVVPGEGRVLYLAMDRPQQAARSLARIVRPEWRPVLEERLIVWQGPPPADFAANPSLMVEMCRAAGADTIAVDSIKDAAVGLSKDDIGAGYNRARQLAIRSGVQVVELHHQRKSGGEGNKKPNSLSDVYGSTWIPSGAGSVIILWGEAGDPVVDFLHVKQVRNDVGPLSIVHDHHAGRSEIDRGDISKDVVHMASRTPGGLTALMVAKQLYGKTERNDVERARRKLENHVRKGELVSVDGDPNESGGRPQKLYFPVRRSMSGAA
jgi:replicative DNA helicase